MVSFLVLLLDNGLKVLEQHRPEFFEQPVMVQTKQAGYTEAPPALLVVRQGALLELLVHGSVEDVSQEKPPKLVQGVHLRSVSACRGACLVQLLLHATVYEVLVLDLNVVIGLEITIGWVAEFVYGAMPHCICTPFLACHVSRIIHKHPTYVRAKG